MRLYVVRHGESEANKKGLWAGWHDVSLTEKGMKDAEGVTEELKAENPMEWVRHCNNIRNRVDEIVLNELIYA